MYACGYRMLGIVSITCSSHSVLRYSCRLKAWDLNGAKLAVLDCVLLCCTWGLTLGCVKVNPIEEKLARWTQCQLSGEPLQQPVVADQLGYLFNKDAVIQVCSLCNRTSSV